MDVLKKAVEDGLPSEAIEALAICQTSGMDGVKRIERWMGSNNATDHDATHMAYRQALDRYAVSIGIEVMIKNGNITYYDGWYYLHDAMWQRIADTQRTLTK